MVALTDSVTGIDPESRFEARQNLAELHFDLGDRPAAEALLQDALESTAGSDDAAEVAYARACLTMAEQRVEAGDTDAAVAQLKALGDRLAHTLGPEALLYGKARDELAGPYDDRGDALHAEGALQEALGAFTAALGPEHQYVKVTESNIAFQLVMLGRPEEALSIVDRIESWFKVHARSRFLELDETRAGALIGLGRFSEALAALDVVTEADLQKKA